MCNCNYKCNCSSNSIVSKQVVLNNNTIGRDGENIYEFEVRHGFEGTEQELSELLINNSYTEDNW